jgi:hypothetical protein
MLVHKKETKEQDTPYRLFSETRFAQTAACQNLPLNLRYSAR